MGRGKELYNKAKQIIPGGTQLLSKRPEMFLPEGWPAYYSKAKGIEVWDLDGNKFLDFSYMGIGANVLGYAFDEVDAAAREAIELGGMCTLNAPEEVGLAELLLKIHPWADMVRYAKAGGEAMAIATRIARAHTRKDIVLVCGYHGWHDWYLAANLTKGDPLAEVHLHGLEPLGVPQQLAGSNLIFKYNDTDAFMQLLKDHGTDVAAVIIEPIRNNYPSEGFLETIASETSKRGIVLVFDEISSGFRLCTGGSHLSFGVTPDIAVFGKGMANGYPISAIIGRKEVMQSAQDTFISSTFWTERVALSAAIKCIELFDRNNVSSHLTKIGKMVQEGWQGIAHDTGVSIEVGGIYPLSHFSFCYPNPLAYKTFITQEMLKLGYLASTAFYSSYAHISDAVGEYLKACEKVFQMIAGSSDIEGLLEGPVCHGGFQRLN